MERLINTICYVGAGVLLLSWLVFSWNPQLASPLMLAVMILAGVSLLIALLALQSAGEG